MSSTNGAGEPSMEEILASIRNIIAQEPGDEASQSSAGAAPGAGGSSFAPSGVGTSSAPVSQDFTAPPSKSASSDNSRPSSVGPLSERLQQGGGSSASSTSNAPTAAPADDFSDVFDEPLKQVPLTTTRFSAKSAQSDFSNPSPVPSANSPRLPDGGASGSGPTVIAKQDPVLPGRGAGAQSTGGSDPVLPHKKADSDLATPPAGGFDFGALRPRRSDAEVSLPPVKPAEDTSAAAPESLEETIAKLKAKSAAQQAGAASAETDDVEATSTPASEDDAGKPTVIAAMPNRPEPEETETAAAPEAEAGLIVDEDEEPTEVVFGNSGQSDDDADDGEKSDHASDFGAKANGAASLVNGLSKSSVGFLSSKPRPLDAGDSTQHNGTPSSAALKNEFSSNLAPETPVADASGDAPQTIAAMDRSAEEPTTPVTEASDAKEDAAEAPVSEAAASSPSEAAASEEPAKAPEPDANGVMTAAAGLTAANLVVSSQGGAVKTLEDTVAELLRPLLREWLENNMPRIVENALRLEVADSVKKQLEITTRKPNGLDHK